MGADTLFPKKCCRHERQIPWLTFTPRRVTTVLHQAQTIVGISWAVDRTCFICSIRQRHARECSAILCDSFRLFGMRIA